MNKVILAAGSMCLSLAMAQSPGGNQGYAERLKPTNDWQAIPRAPQPMPGDTAARAMRRARDAWMDRFYGVQRPLDQDPNQLPLGHMDRVPVAEIPGFGPLTVAVATFKESDVVFSESRRSIYTQQHWVVEKVLATVRPNVVAGATLTTLVVGGAALLQTAAIQYLVNPTAEALEPGHRYLLFLQLHADGDFFGVVKAWEFVDGKAMPCWREDVIRAMKGESQYAGMEEPAFIQTVEQAIRVKRLRRGDQ